MTTVDEILSAPWHAVIRARRVPSGWALSADAAPVEGDVLYGGAIEDHAYWMGLCVGEASRWHASSAARSEERFVDDSPAVDELWVVATGAIELEVELWVRLGDVDGASHEERAFRARTTVDAEGRFELLLETAADFHAPRAVDARAILPRDVVRLTRDGGYARAVVPSLGVLESGPSSWALHTPAGRIALPEFAPTADADASSITVAHDGHVLVHWARREGGGHLSVYRLPAARPLATLSKDVDVGAPAVDVDGSAVWLVGGGHARRCDLASGATLETHVTPVPSSANVGFGARARRLAWHEVFDFDEPLSAVLWFDLEGSLHQLLVPDVLDGAPAVLAAGEIVAWGRRGFWCVDVERTSVVCILHKASAPSFVAEREGDDLVVWTPDADAYRIVARVTEP